MDTAQGEEFATLMTNRRDQIASRSEDLASLIGGLDAIWQGSDARSFADRWGSVRAGTIETAIEKLTKLAGDVFENAEAQDVASAADALDAVGEMFSDIFRGGDFDLRNMFPNPNDVEDWIGMGASAIFDGLGGALGGITKWANMPKTLATAMVAGGDDMVGAVRGMGAAASRVSKVLGPVGAVVTGGFAAWDRWEQDSQDPSLSTGEKVLRAGADGVANAGGGALGAWGGAAGGAAIGTMICPGVGTVIGGAIGGIAGGLAGSSAANGLVDWALG